MAAIAVHVVDDDVIAAGHGDAVILVEDDAVANLSVIGSSQIETWQGKKLVICTRYCENKRTIAVVGR
jgi:hypothetical protein